MSMFSIGLSGLKTTESALQVTSNNIANSSTAGFKSGNTQFSSVYNGGQRGGVTVSGIQEDFSRSGETVVTGNSLDLAIMGSGFYVVSENGRIAYTQAGQFNLDNDQYIVSASGANLQGYGVDANGNLVPGVITDLQVNTANIPASRTTNVDFALNLSSASDVIEVDFDPKDGQTYNYSQSTEIFDSLGNSHTLTQYYVHTGSGEWEVHYYMNGEPMNELTDPNDPHSIPTGTPLTQTLTFDEDGNLLEPNPANITLNLDPSETTGGAPMVFNLSMTDTTQYGSGFSIYQNNSDGYTSGEFAGVSVAETGEVFATYTNGQTLLQGQIILADFANLQGLENGNNSVWYATSESGPALYGTPNSGSYGSLLSGAYVGSNVDISEQLVDLMSFQQSYQANAKTISSASEMMQILFNAT